MHVRMHACTVRALRRISFVVFGQLGGVELPRGSHQFSLCHAKLGIEIILNIIQIHVLILFRLFLAEPVVM
jgi:hypothetical protein